MLNNHTSMKICVTLELLELVGQLTGRSTRETSSSRAADNPWRDGNRVRLTPWPIFAAFNQHTKNTKLNRVCLLVGCLTSQQQASVSQGRICSDNFTCCHTEIEVADQTFYLIQSQYTDTGPTSPSADPITPGAWQGSHWSANF